MNIFVLGSTGSVGKQALNVIKRNRDSGYKAVALCVHSNTELLLKQVNEFSPSFVGVYDQQSASRIKPFLPSNVKLFSGKDCATEIAMQSKVDAVLAAASGIQTINAVLVAIENKKRVGLANKEALVTAGQLIVNAAKKHNAVIIPVDSEHSAVFQCLQGQKGAVKRIVLTASGGAFRDLDKQQISVATAAQALKHPTYSMGNKITVDSATLMNKGLEVIEAKWLFDVDQSDIDVCLHRQSIVHSMVEFEDTSVIAQMSYPDMEIPIQLAFSFPNRLPVSQQSLDFTNLTLNFEKVDGDRFPCLQLARNALEMGGLMPTVLNAANDITVDMYLNGKIGFYGISDMIFDALKYFDCKDDVSMDAINKIDGNVRRYIKNMYC